MTVLVIATYVVCALTALLGVYYVVKDLAADLVLLGGCALLLIVWGVQASVLAVHDATGGVVEDPITLYGYLLSGIALPAAGIWLGFGERSRWGSAAILIVAVTMAVLELRLPQIWPGGF
ncbi:hypothetical protein BRM3_11755 [Brachybacterium huguangmaarense]|uniref:Integral membrane protein n=1 Tax=Brachybacterium huguangmaarense TaxID=1652028 RepID=A0ABY6FZA5_9MICO|nr:hypothetical protein [Brachybacterium huguangmaarense]UYG16278.1 hypothetical protein BRM3_11755 [Brachybacterium huguangmaarense]